MRVLYKRQNGISYKKRKAEINSYFIFVEHNLIIAVFMLSIYNCPWALSYDMINLISFYEYFKTSFAKFHRGTYYYIYFW